ncbi:MAG TPA: polysaccharide deacetylase family protein [Mycobacteriales bacterium]|nr:polysaccharide deacetylase family protein [Mycobacteriales bacterium]
MGLARWLVVVLVTTGCLVSSVPPADVPSVRVGARSVPLAGVTTVAEALRQARVVVPAGRVLTLVSHRPIDGDHQPGQVLLDGHPVAPDTRVTPGSVLTVLPGADVTEPVEVRTEQLPVSPGVASLYIGARPATVRVVRGKLSGETSRRQVLVPSHPGHLVRARAYALTFDDGPDPTWTPRVLRLLAAAHARATFCVVGRQVARHPELVRAIVRGGHALCNHSWSHDERLPSRSPAVVTRELARTQAAVRRAAGVTPRLFRAPGGVWSPALEREARRQGMSTLGWNVDPRDWTTPGARAIAREVLRGVRPGAVVLLHDGGGHRGQTLVAVRFLLARLRALHYQPSPVVP